ncbi:tumor necrosis factor receptor superfamily member 1A isoform X2 [Vombatus ursinus]|uniref:Tumor necrosis factor receptor superfamily member 1A n=1 Tax=Vombatus ursinus TaxID=29139 RepID=A0A4X2LSW0_VOMUR|nr:tumor necrosis factor receptor superfamily member 1A isoform X2 [Vombatus ursinus]
MGHPTLPGLVPLVALALMVGLYLPVAPGMSTHKRHQEKRDIECPQGKYKHPKNESICCLKCHKGTYLEADCGGPDLAPNCKTCEKGTYTEIENYFSRCHSCSVCRKEMGQILKKTCTVSRNTVCGCGENQFQQRQGDKDNGLFRCVNCNPCLNGTIRHPCQEKQDAVCICNKDFFWHGHKCISCDECVPEKNCMSVCTPSFVKSQPSGPVLMPLVIFLGFCCFSLIFIVSFCHYPRWRSKLYVIVCGRQSPPVKEEENKRALVPPPTLDFTPVPSQTLTSSPAPAPAPAPAPISVSTAAPPLPSTFSSSNWSTVYNVQPIVTLAPPQQRAEPTIHCAQMPSDCVVYDVTALRLDRPAKLYAVVDEVPPTRWREFIRRLGLNENDIELCEMQNPRCLREAHYSMLAAWQKGVPRHQATLEVLAQVLTDMDLHGCLQNITETLKLGNPSGPLSPLSR